MSSRDELGGELVGPDAFKKRQRAEVVDLVAFEDDADTPLPRPAEPPKLIVR